MRTLIGGDAGSNGGIAGIETRAINLFEPGKGAWELAVYDPRGDGVM